MVIESLQLKKRSVKLGEKSEDASEEERKIQTDKMLQKFRNKLILEDKSNNTLKNYTYALKKFLQHLETLEVDEIELEDIEEFLLEIEGKKSKARHAFALKSFFTLMGRKKLAEQIPIPRYMQKLPRSLKKKRVLYSFILVFIFFRIMLISIFITPSSL